MTHSINLLDEDSHDNLVMQPLIPTIKYVKKKTDDIIKWFSELPSKIVKKVLPPAIQKLIDLSKNVVYEKRKETLYWGINRPFSSEDIITKNIANARKKV